MKPVTATDAKARQHAGMKRFFSAACLAACMAAAAAAPVAVSLPSAISLLPYTGSEPVNAGRLDTDDVLWIVREQAHDGLQAWYLFYDPLNPRRLQATLDFGTAIVAVYSTRDELIASEAGWQVDIDGDGLFDDYARRPLMGLEAADTLNWALGGTQLTLDWRSDEPGDHVRVLVQADPASHAVPEPASAALVLLALAAAGAAHRRRSA